MVGALPGDPTEAAAVFYRARHLARAWRRSAAPVWARSQPPGRPAASSRARAAVVLGRVICRPCLSVPS